MNITHAIISQESTNIMGLDLPKWSIEIFPKKVFVGLDKNGQHIMTDGLNYVLSIRDTLGIQHKKKTFRELLNVVPSGSLGSLETFTGPMADSKKQDPVMITYTWDDIAESSKLALGICDITHSTDEILDGFKNIVWPRSKKVYDALRKRRSA